MLHSASFVVSFRRTGRVLINSFYMRRRGTYPYNIIPDTFPPYAPTSLSLSLSISSPHYLSPCGCACVMCMMCLSLSRYRIATPPPRCFRLCIAIIKSHYEKRTAFIGRVFTAHSIRMCIVCIKTVYRSAGKKREIITRFYDNNIYYFIAVEPRATVEITAALQQQQQQQ